VFEQNYCVRGLELFSSYLFKDILELYDWNLTGNKHLHTHLYIYSKHIICQGCKLLPYTNSNIVLLSYRS